MDGEREAILVADDHAVYRYGLALLLKDTLKPLRVIEADNFDTALQMLDGTPDIRLAIFDLAMPGLAGPHQLEQVRRKRPEILVVVLTAYNSRDHVLAAIAAGVHGYIVKSHATDALIASLRRVLAGEISVPPLVAELPPQALAKKPGTSQLSERQQQVLCALIAGKSNKQIADELKVSEGTVKVHIAALMRLLGATNRTHAAALGKQLFP